MKVKNNKQKGFTLVEFMIYIGIFSVMAISILGLAGTILQPKVKVMVINEVEKQGAQVIQQVTQTIRNAEGINSPSRTNTAASLSLDVVDVADDPTVFDLSSGIFQITEGLAASVPLTSDRVVVSGLQFKNVTRPKGYGSIKFQFTIDYYNPAGINDFEYSKTFYATADLRQ